MSGNRSKFDQSNSTISVVGDSIDPAIKDAFLFTLPTELLLPDTDESVSITSGGSEETQNEFLRKLSQTCHFAHHFFKPELDKRGANKLLRWVLQGPLPAYQNHEAKIIELAKSRPHLFFIQSTAQDNAMDLKDNRRTLPKWSPYQAFFGTGNWELLKKVKPHLDAYLKKINNEELALAQEKEKFLDGFDFPPSTPEFIAALKELIDAINKDEHLKLDWRNPNARTKAALEKYQEVAMPLVVETGHHHNMNDTINIQETYYQGWYQQDWNDQRCTFFCVNVIGFDQRLMTEFQLRAACTGLVNYLTQQKPLNQHFEVMNHTCVPYQRWSVVPLNSGDLTTRLGVEVFVISDFGCGSRFCLRFGFFYWKAMSSIHSSAFKTYAQAKEAASSIVMRDYNSC